jgi:uncharacterized protein YbjT (DUF2867 family)
MITVTTPTGHIGSQLVKLLLAAGEPVRVIVRDPAKLAPEIRDAVSVAQGSSDDERVLYEALDGAESFFLIVPPSFASTDYTEYCLQFTRPALRAMQRHGVKRIVSVSGIGRDPKVKAGPVSATLVKDLEIERSGVDFRALWCPGFMENMLRQVELLRQHDVFAGPGRADLKQPMVTTRDIAASAATLLTDRTWNGQGGLAVLGPEDLSLNDMAAILSDVLRRQIRFQHVPDDAYKAQLMQHGASEQMAQGLIDMRIAKDNGLDLTEPRTAQNTTPTSFRQWSEEVLNPLVAGA